MRHRVLVLVFGVTFAAGLAACDGAEDPPPAKPSSASSPSSPPGSDAGAASPDEKAPGPVSCAGNDASEVPPTTPNELHAWLTKRTYTCWPGESAPHGSTGPHGGDVQTYVNASLDSSLKSASSEHPVGAASVKELIANGEVTGWAVLVKNRASGAGDAFYWYEVFDTTSPASPIEGQGKSLCAGCHARGKDFVLTPYPLR